MNPASNRANARQRGFSLIEVLMSTMLVGVAISNTISFGMTTKNRAMQEEAPAKAHMIAKEAHQMAKDMLLRGITLDINGSELSFEDLDGRTFSPPILATGASYSDLSGWSQVLSVDVADFDDLQNEEDIADVKAAAASVGATVESLGLGSESLFDARSSLTSADLTTEGHTSLKSTAAALYRLKVAVEYDGERIDSYSWWMRP